MVEGLTHLLGKYENLSLSFLHPRTKPGVAVCAGVKRVRDGDFLGLPAACPALASVRDPVSRN